MKTRTSTAWTAGLVLMLVTAFAPASRAQSEPKPAAPAKPVATPALPSTLPGPGLGQRTAPFDILPPTGPWFPPATQSRPPFRNQLSYWAGEIVKLAQAGVDDSVILAFLDDVGTFNLGADDIIYLHDLGVSSQVITAMLQHDFEFAAGNRPANAWIMPFSKPAIHLVFTTNSDTAPRVAPSSAPVPAASANSVPAGAVKESMPDAGQSLLTEFSVFDYTMAAADADRQVGLEAKPKLYAVREPYPVKLTDPIFIYRTAGMMPNVQVVELFP